MLREYLQFFRNYRNITKLPPRYFWLSLITAILFRLAALLLPFFAAFIIDALTIKDVTSTYLHLSLFTAVLLFYYIMLYLHYKIYGRSLNDCYDRIQHQLLQKLVTIDNDFVRKISKGRVINTVHDYLIDIANANNEIADLVAGLVQVIVTCLIIGYYSIPIMLLMILFVVVYVAASRYIDRRFNYYRRKNINHDNAYSTIITQVLGGLQEIKSFNILAKFENRVSMLQRKFNSDYDHQRRYAIHRDNDVIAIQYILQFIAYIILIFMVTQQEIAVGILVMIVTYQGQLFSCARRFAQSAISIREVQLSIDSVQKILGYKTPTHHFGDLDLDDISGLVNFRQVSLRAKDKKPILKNINLTLRPHQFTVIVGPPGSGKSPLFDLLLRLEQPTSGQITIDGINIKKFSTDIHSENVVMAGQAPYLFNASIRRNLSFVDPDPERQIEACKIVGIHDFIESLPSGYQTILHKNAHNVSGGQRQMISIARTILSRAEIILFDDIAAALDADTAAHLPAIINRLKTDHTIVMITRKPELMMAADRVIVMNKGRIIDKGTHAGLLKRCKIYRDLQLPTTSMNQPITEPAEPSELPSQLIPQEDFPDV